MHRSIALLPLLLALVLAGCTTAGSGSSADKFEGAESDVAQVVDDLSAAAGRRDGEKICAEYLSRSLVRSLSTQGTSCNQEMEKATNDASDFDLNVRDVTVEATSATARVQRGDDGPTSTFELVKEDNRWKLSGLEGT